MQKTILAGEATGLQVVEPLKMPGHFRIRDKALRSSEDSLIFHQAINRDSRWQFQPGDICFREDYPVRVVAELKSYPALQPDLPH